MLHVKRRIQNYRKKPYLCTPLTKKIYINTNSNVKPLLSFNSYLPMKQINGKSEQKVTYNNKTVINRNLE